jgi:membrane protein DedA with SNARE-associated domain
MVFLGRLIPIFRTVISFPAGAVKMSIPKFVALTTVGCLIWNSILIYVGFYLGNKWREVAGVSRYLVIAVIVVAFLLFAAYLARRRKRLRA